MTVKERINTLFAKYNVDLSAQDVEAVELASLELEDGTVFNSEDEAVIVGSQVTVENADGESIPVPSGDYTAANGSVYVIKDGIVESITEAEAEVEEVVEEAPEVEVEAAEEIEVVAEATDVELKAELTALKAELATFKAEFAEVKALKESKEAELLEVKANFEAQGLPQTIVKSEAKPQLTQKDIKSMTPQERVAHINSIYTKNK